MVIEGALVAALKPDPAVVAKWELMIAGMDEGKCVGMIKRMREKEVEEWNVNTRRVYGMLKNRLRWFREQKGLRLGRLYREGQEADERAADELIMEIGGKAPYEALGQGALGGKPAWAGELEQRRRRGAEAKAKREARRHW